MKKFKSYTIQEIESIAKEESGLKGEWILEECDADLETGCMRYTLNNNGQKANGSFKMTVIEPERQLLGRIGVDSGQIMIMDPCYIENQWIKRTDKGAAFLGFEFWGSGHQEARNFLQEHYKGNQYSLGSASETKSYFKCPENESEEIQERLRKFISHPIRKKIVTFDKHSCTFDSICEATDDDYLQGGSVPYQLGHEGLLVAARSGLGDGFYSVYATYEELEDWGRRIKKLEIEFF